MHETISYIIICICNVAYAVWNSKLIDQSSKDIHDLQITFQLIAINNDLLLRIRENEIELSKDCINSINEVLSINKTFVKSTYMYSMGEKRE